MGRKPSAVLRLWAADAQFAAFRLPARLVEWGRRLSEKWQKRWTGTKRLHDGDTFRRKDLHDAVRAGRKDNPSSAGRPGNGRFGLRILWVLGSLLDAA
jgi:hypothetical protein